MPPASAPRATRPERFPRLDRPVPAARGQIDVLTDALGERLAFERSGVRLYGAVIERCRAHPDSLSSEELASLHDFRGDECLHVELVRDALRDLGTDPLRASPGAVRVAGACAGLFQVASDPRTTPRHALQALLDAELVDNAGWDLLIEIVRAVERTELADTFTHALVQENRHLHAVRDIVARLTLQETLPLRPSGRR